MQPPPGGGAAHSQPRIGSEMAGSGVFCCGGQAGGQGWQGRAPRVCRSRGSFGPPPPASPAPFGNPVTVFVLPSTPQAQPAGFDPRAGTRAALVCREGPGARAGERREVGGPSAGPGTGPSRGPVSMRLVSGIGARFPPPASGSGIPADTRGREERQEILGSGSNAG